LTTRPATLHFLGTQLLPVESALETTVQVMDGIQRLLSSHKKHLHMHSNQCGHLKHFQSSTASHRGQVRSCTRHLQTLLKRCASTTHLLDQLATSKNQKIAQQQNTHLTELTKSTLNDSNAIRVITVITLLYLPLSAVGVRYP
jgi:Mg2+ and Co2+ transporter CorA